MEDIEIARNVKPLKIEKVAKKLGLKKNDIELFGQTKCKINKSFEGEKHGKLILVTAMNPTIAGNGKTTVSVGLADAFALKKKRVCLALREPSLGPVFGRKGGACGGGQSQIIPMDEINLHFTGDFHAITSANNLLCSLIDNSLSRDNPLNIDENNIFFNRCLDLNDRALRNITVGQSKNSVPRSEKFVITAASEIMAILCLSKNLDDLKLRLGKIMVALNKKGKPVYASDLKAENAMTILLKDAFKPNLVQTLYGTPAIVHCGPFANIAHGCNSIIATKTAISAADFCITEAGFGADLGAEKFFDVKCRLADIKPNCVVLIGTIPALKLHAEVDKNNLKVENTDAIKKGLSNLIHHINVLKNVYKVNVVVTLNKHVSDTPAEIEIVEKEMQKLNIPFAVNNVWAEGGKGALELAEKVLYECKKPSSLEFAYQLTDTVKNKIFSIASKVYGASKVEYTSIAEEKIKLIKKLGLTNLPIVMAKTQYSLTDNEKIMGAPKNFTISVQDIELKTGAGFLVAILGNMLLMPALPSSPVALQMKIDSDGIISGLF